jgi:hypothetical protein
MLSWKTSAVESQTRAAGLQTGFAHLPTLASPVIRRIRSWQAVRTGTSPRRGARRAGLARLPARRQDPRRGPRTRQRQSPERLPGRPIRDVPGRVSAVLRRARRLPGVQAQYVGSGHGACTTATSQSGGDLTLLTLRDLGRAGLTSDRTSLCSILARSGSAHDQGSLGSAGGTQPGYAGASRGGKRRCADWLTQTTQDQP